MTDIIERLERQWAALDPVDEYRADARDAIDEIERLRAELDALKAQEPVASLFRTTSTNLIECFYKGTMCPIDGNRFHKDFVDALPLGKAVPLYLAPQPAIPDGWRLEAEIHKVAKHHMSKKAQGYFMGGIRKMLAAAPKPGDAK